MARLLATALLFIFTVNGFAEPMVVGDKLYVANFDSTGNMMVNTKHDAPHAISVITLD